MWRWQSGIALKTLDSLKYSPRAGQVFDKFETSPTFFNISNNHSFIASRYRGVVQTTLINTYRSCELCPFLAVPKQNSHYFITYLKFAAIKIQFNDLFHIFVTSSHSYIRKISSTSTSVDKRTIDFRISP